MRRHSTVTTKVRIEKHLRTILPVAAVLVIGAAAIFSVLVYKISNPGAVAEAVNPSHYLLPSLEVEITAGQGTKIPAWWIPGLKNAPGIILSTGYGMSRSDALSLAARLHNNGYNLLIYAQRGSIPYPQKASTLGLYEADDMLEAVRLLQSRPESDRTRLGIWGVDIGAYAALKAASEFPEILAIAADNPYETVDDFLNYRIAEDFGADNRFVRFCCRQIFHAVHFFSGIPMNEGLDIEALSKPTILFIKGENRKDLGSLTMGVYDRIHPRKEMISLKAARVHLMRGEELKSYDRQVSSFFDLYLR